MNRIVRNTALTAFAAALALGASACSAQDQEAAPAEPTVGTAAEATEAVNAFFAAATSKDVAEAAKGKPSAEVFAPALDLVAVPASDPGAVEDALADLALLSADSKDLKLALDAKDVTIDGTSAAIPASAVSVTAGGKPVKADRGTAHIASLEYVDGQWLMSFQSAETPAASAK